MSDRARGRAKAALLSALLLGACVTASAPPDPPALRELIWTDPAADRAHVLTHEPGECLAQRTLQIDAGRALFMSRTLLGGPAARTGLSCASCHINGRANTHFLLPELTDRAGHADVTSEWSSKTRGDGLANPQVIPDLAGVAARPAFGHQREPSLRAFVHGVIVDEFQGTPPPQPAEDALLAYLSALDPARCAPETLVSLATLADDVRRAFSAMRAEHDRVTAELLLLATQDALARLVERLPSSRFARERHAIESLSRDLIVARAQTDLAAALDALGPSWRARFDALTRRLERRERETYANEEGLRRGLSR